MHEISDLHGQNRGLSNENVPYGKESQLTNLEMNKSPGRNLKAKQFKSKDKTEK